MGNFCLPAVLVLSRRYLLGYLLLLSLVIPVEAASNQATAVLHIRITVVPAVQMTATQPATTSSAGSISYTLRPSTARNMTRQITVQQISNKPLSNNSARNTVQPRKGAVLQTTTIVVE
jgi:hypothetical protein